MSQENLDALKRLYERWGAGDWADASVFDTHAVGVFPDLSPRGIYGLEALSEYMRRFLESWDDLRMEATDYRAAGDSFVVQVRRIAAGKRSGVPLEDRTFHVWTFRGGVVIRVEVFDRESDALEAVGLRE